MADGLHTPEHVRCLDCWAREQAVPAEAQLRVLAHEDWLAEAATFVPRAMTQDQAVASEMLTAALGRFISAYGVSIAAPRLASMLNVLRHQAKLEKVTGRILKARASINARARARYAVGDIAGAHAIEAEPTPNYPGKARDDAWLSEGQPKAKQLQEALG